MLKVNLPAALERNHPFFCLKLTLNISVKIINFYYFSAAKITNRFGQGDHYQPCTRR